MPGYELVADVDPAHWGDVMNLEWSMATLGFAYAWRQAKENYLDLAFAPFAET